MNLHEFTGAFRNLQEWILHVSSFTFTKSEFKGIYKGLQEFIVKNFTGVFFHFHKKWIYMNLQGLSGIYRGEFYRDLLSLSQKVNLQVPFQEFTGMNFTGVFFHFHKKWILKEFSDFSLVKEWIWCWVPPVWQIKKLCAGCVWRQKNNIHLTNAKNICSMACFQSV